MILARFDGIVLAFILPALGIAIAIRHPGTVTRALTLLAILATLTAALALRPEGVLILTGLLAALSWLEVSRVWKVPLAVTGATSAVGLWILLSAGETAALAVFGSLVTLSWFTPTRVIRSPVAGLVLSLGIITEGLFFFYRIAGMGLRPILTLVFLLQMSDAFGYFGGKIWGRRHVVSRVSPGKTLEGYLASALGVVIGVLLCHDPLGTLARASWGASALVGVFILVVGNMGDLYFSMIKRHWGIKDFSGLLPGHGGILDRFDNFIVASPGFFLLWQNMFLRGH